MPWELEIHHIQVTSLGDATLFIARNINPPNAPVVRSLLIDGGKNDPGGVAVDNYIRALPLARLDVMVATHFDIDHFTGLTYLLRQALPSPYSNVIIYDQGEPPNESVYFSRKTDRNGNIIPSYYEKYIAAIAARPNVRRATSLVNSFDIVRYNNATNAATIPRGVVQAGGINYLDPAWLVGKEILWGNGMDGQNGRPNYASNPPAGAPTITCIAANKYVQQNAGMTYDSNVVIYDGPRRMNQAQIARAENVDLNGKSLAFLVQFNNFRYYVGGDITTDQEDGCNNRNMNPVAFQQGIRHFINGNNTVQGRIVAMKASHHGSNTATSRTFATQMRPSATVISNGDHGRLEFPAAQTVNVLDGYPEQPILANRYLEHPPQPPQPPQRQNRNYLTFYRDATYNPPLSFGGVAAITAGNPIAPINPGDQPLANGDIRLSVSLAQSQIPVVGQVYRGVLAAVDQIVAATGLALNANENTTIADAAATFGLAAAVALALGCNAATAVDGININDVYQATVNAVAYAGNDTSTPPIGVVTSAIEAAPGGLQDAIDAAAEVEGGDCVAEIGNGAAEAVGEAVTGGNAAAIRAAALAANPAATNDSATAAGNAAAGLRQMIIGAGYVGVVPEYNAGYAVAAAMGAVTGGANLAQATVMGVTCGAAYPIGVDLNGDNLYADGRDTATWVAQTAVTAGIAQQRAALAGAVAAAAYYEGDPNETGNGVEAALQVIVAAGAVINGTANAAGVAATNAATLNPNNELFLVHLYDRDSPAPQPGNIAHSW